MNLMPEYVNAVSAAPIPGAYLVNVFVGDSLTAELWHCGGDLARVRIVDEEAGLVFASYAGDRDEMSTRFLIASADLQGEIA